MGFVSSERIGSSNNNSIGNRKAVNMMGHEANTSYLNLGQTPLKDKGFRSQSETRHHTSTTPIQAQHQGLYSHISLKEASPMRT